LAQYLDCHLRREVARTSATKPPQKDSRLSAKATDDYSVAVIMGVAQNGYYLLDCWQK